MDRGLEPLRLCEAFERGDEEWIRDCWTSQPRLFYKIRIGCQSMTPLLVAIRKHRSDWIMRILEGPSCSPHYVNEPDHMGCTALRRALEYALPLEIIKALIAKGASPTKTSHSGVSPLYRSVTLRRYEAIKEMLPIVPTEKCVMDCLKEAARIGHLPTLRLLLDNLTTQSHRSLVVRMEALSWALYSHRMACALAIANHCPGVLTVQSRTGKTVMDMVTAYALRHRDYLPLFRSILRLHTVHTSLAFCINIITRRATHLLSIVMRESKDRSSILNWRSHSHQGTLLMVASIQNSSSCAQILLQGGIDINAVDAQGNTALMHAAANRNIAIAYLLLVRGADPFKTNRPDGRTAAHIMVHRCDPHIQNAFWKILSAKGFSINVPDAKGITPLMQAAASPQVIIVRQLLEHGTDVNKTDEAGRTALFYACRRGSIPVIESLLQHGADIDAIEMLSGCSCLVYAVLHHHHEALHLLLQHRPRYYDIHPNGRSLLRFARATDPEGECLRVLERHHAMLLREALSKLRLVNEAASVTRAFPYQQKTRSKRAKYLEEQFGPTLAHRLCQTSSLGTPQAETRDTLTRFLTDVSPEVFRGVMAFV